MKNYKILFVEKNEDIVYQFSKIFESNSITVIYAKHGLEILEIFNIYDFDLIITRKDRLEKSHLSFLKYIEESILDMQILDLSEFVNMNLISRCKMIGIRHSIFETINSESFLNRCKEIISSNSKIY